VVIDNVWGDQLEWLLPRNIMQVLGEGSMVLVTSREATAAAKFVGRREEDEEEAGQRVQEVEMGYLQDKESMELFCLYAFGSCSIPACEKQWEKQVVGLVRRCGGLPMAVEVLGRHLKASSATGPMAKHQFWKRVEEELLHAYERVSADRLDGCPTLNGALELTWNVLDEEEQATLLDIAWFLKGQEWELVAWLCEHRLLERLEQLGLVKQQLDSSCARSKKQLVYMHDAMVDFCKRVSKGTLSQRLVLNGGGRAGDAAEASLQSVKVCHCKTPP
jgi:NB-ARC domain